MNDLIINNKTNIIDRMVSVNSAFDSLAFIMKFVDYCNTVELFICERQQQCECKDECWCNSEKYVRVRNLIIDEGSNCNGIMQLIFQKRIRFSKKMYKRVFTIDKNGEEIPLCDIRMYDIVFYLHDQTRSYKLCEKGAIFGNIFNARFDMRPV